MAVKLMIRSVEGKNPTAILYISKELAKTRGWSIGTKLDIKYNDGIFEIRPESNGYSLVHDHRFYKVQITLKGVKAKRMTTKLVHFELVDDGLVIKQYAKTA